jgi:hypothetical protein
MVWLRMGDEPTSSLVPFLLNDQIWTFVNDLTCISSISEENFYSEEIQLYPNPANEQITISVNKGRLGTVLIYNQLGQTIAEIYCDSNSKTINLSCYQNGLYFLNFPEKGFTLKFSKGN